jgi:hypothetical protein
LAASSKGEKMGRYILSHDWGILGKRRKQRWPGPDKRSLRVSIWTFTDSIALGARHWYATVEEERNQWWSEKEGAWVELSCDSENRGFNLRADVNTEKEAIKIAKIFIELVAGKDRKHHEITWSGPGKPKWAL